MEASGVLTSTTKLDGRDRAILTQAISDLQASLQADASDSHSYLLLGRAFLLAGDLDRSVQAYRTYTQLRPGDPLGHLESGFAQDALCLRNNPEVVVVCHEAKSEWQKGGLIPSEFAALGDEAFGQRHWAEAFAWYEQYRRNAIKPWEAVPDQLLFRQAIAAALSANADRDALLGAFQTRDSGFEIYPLADSVRIDGADLQWLNSSVQGITDGTRVAQGQLQEAGTLFWSGQATALLFVEEGGDFRLTTRVEDRTPPL